MPQAPHRLVAPAGHSLDPAQAHALVADACPADDYRGRRVLLIVPDATRTAPVALMFQALHAQIGGVAKKFGVMIALGTHPPMPDDAINQRVGITADQRATTYQNVEFINHEWDNPAALRDREAEGIFLEPKAGERLYHLRDKPAWAGG